MDEILGITQDVKDKEWFGDFGKYRWQPNTFYHKN